jgi:hypothetical protein
MLRGGEGEKLKKTKETNDGRKEEMRTILSTESD